MTMNSADLDDVDFLVRSPGRLDVLDAVRTQPRSRDELLALSDVSRVTMSRILGDFEDREWLIRVNGDYTCTPKGAYVADEVASIASNLRAVGDVEELLAWFPPDAFGFDLHRLTDGVVIESDHSNLDECVQHVIGLFEAASEYRVVADGMAGAIADAAWEATVQNGELFEGILGHGAYEVIRSDPRMRRQVREMVAADAVKLYRFDWPHEFGFQIADDTVSIVGSGGLVETTDEVVWTWARGFFESIRRQAEPVGPELFAEPPRSGNGQRP